MNELDENVEDEIAEAITDKQSSTQENENPQELDEAGTSASPSFPIAGFWRRSFALLIDVLVLSLPLIILGFLFKDMAFSLGPYGRLFGYAIIIGYWTWLNSEKGHGQTVGKRVLNIIVVDKNSQYLVVSKSFLRALTLGLVVMLNGWALPLLQNPILAAIVMVVVFGGGLAIFYGLVFNRTTRQGLHDLFAHAYVVKAPPVPEAVPLALPKVHRRMTYGLLGVGVVVAALSLIFRQFPPNLGIMQEGEWEEIIALQATLSEEDDVFAVAVNRLNRISMNNRTTVKDLNIEVWVKESCSTDPVYCDEFVDEIARTALAEYDYIDNLDGMRISVVNRFDLGFANGSVARGAAFSIADWQERLQQSE